VRDAAPTATHQLAWDGRVAFGSRQHFYHFLLGYLLPALHLVRTHGRDRHYVLDSCGPVMDVLIDDAMALLGVELWSVDSTVAAERVTARLVVPRWDIRLLRDQLVGTEDRVHHRIRAMREDLRAHPDVAAELERSDTIPRLLADITDLRSSLLETVGLTARPAMVTGERRYLVLQRSEQPAFYARGGPAEIPGYGTFRRTLHGTDEGVAWLSQHGYAVSSFEPGARSLGEQIRAFGSSAGAIGIAGAEFANVVWMSPGSRVVVLRPTVMDHPFVTEVLARLLRIDYVEIPVEGTTPRFDPTAVAPSLLRHTA
jgi:hypothetical protein